LNPSTNDQFPGERRIIAGWWSAADVSIMTTAELGTSDRLVEIGSAASIRAVLFSSAFGRAGSGA
jgi:hypothetical protein